MRVLLIFVLLSFPLAAHGELHTGDVFPSFDLKEGLNDKDLAYLGLKKGLLSFGARTDLKDVSAELLLVVFMNRYCITCQKEAPELVSLYGAVQNEKALRGVMKILGVAIGNSPKEVEDFKREHAIPFPILSDTETRLFKSIGSPGGSPLFFVLRKTQSGWIIADGFKGEQRHEDMRVRAVSSVNSDPAAIVRKPLWEEKPLRKLTQIEVLALLKKAFPNVRVLKTLPFVNGDLYVVSTGKETLFAKVEARRLMCSVCHDITFIYVFDRKGNVRDLIPVELAKDGNVPLSKADMERLRSRVVGRNMLAPFKFDRDVDAVTSATLTSFAVLDAVFRSKDLLKTVENEGY